MSKLKSLTYRINSIDSLARIYNPRHHITQKFKNTFSLYLSDYNQKIRIPSLISLLSFIGFHLEKGNPTKGSFFLIFFNYIKTLQPVYQSFIKNPNYTNHSTKSVKLHHRSLSLDNYRTILG